MQYRQGEPAQTRFRAERYFAVGEDYYFSTREGTNVGPFPNIAAARRGAELYIQCINRKEEAGMYASKIAMQGLWASTNFS